MSIPGDMDEPEWTSSLPGHTSNTQKYDSGLSLLRHKELHWLDVIDRVRYKLAVLAYRYYMGPLLST